MAQSLMTIWAIALLFGSVYSVIIMIRASGDKILAALEGRSGAVMVLRERRTDARRSVRITGTVAPVHFVRLRAAA